MPAPTLDDTLEHKQRKNGETLSWRSRFRDGLDESQHGDSDESEAHDKAISIA
ncbi:hypothetical protein TIFTF001_027927 [Ficus carica]|uniref:Uncharacterized protein n=1 Tax=Ficus carica TaxID=3494 RepID=A0AA88IVR9_FICCA|nr:hypothetical protein TIFTF001_027927 [Ficus carica]